MNKPKKKELPKFYHGIMAATLAVSTFFITTPIYANGTNVGQNTANFLNSITGPVLPAIIVVILIFLLIKRDWIKVISTVGIFLVVAYFTDWTSVKTLSSSIFGSIFK
ncbi:hypothetical protein ACE41H_15460 [Paenibacillus enshidis]|uniref:TrbC/VirB2 family protein n=1 Tax=Paenibacillus enshidis TaxID=1458439 RepID=A0ABV5AVW6_9BACL